MTAPTLDLHRPPCGVERHDHPVPPTGGRCAFPVAPDRLCGRPAAAVYVNERAWPRNTYRCARHDRDVVVAAAADLGFRRMAVEP